MRTKTTAAQRLIATHEAPPVEILTVSPETWAKQNGYKLVKGHSTYTVRNGGRQIGGLVHDGGHWKFFPVLTEKEQRELNLENWIPEGEWKEITL